MGVYFRTSRSTGIYVPFLLAPFVWVVWLYGLLIVLLVKALVLGLVASWRLTVLVAPYVWRACYWMGWAWLWFAGWCYGWAGYGVGRARRWWADRREQ